MIAPVKVVKSALLAHLVSSVAAPFVANAAAGSTMLTAVSVTADLFAGLPVFGPGIPSATVITEIDPVAGIIGLSETVTKDGTDVGFTTGFQTSGGRLQTWNKVSAQPALFLRRIAMLDEAFNDGLIRTTIEFQAWLYCNSGQNPEVDPDEMLSAVEALVRNAMAPDLYDEDDGRFTLRAAMEDLGQPPVFWARIQGRSEISAGEIGSQAIAIIPIRVTLP